jgi:plastocyanin
MLATVNSAAVVLAVVFGIPLILVVLGIVLTRPRFGAPILGLATLVAAGLVAVAVWGVFRPSGEASPAIGAQPNSGQVSTQPGGTGGSACTPKGPTLRLTAKSIRFDTSCLAAPADTPFTIRFENADAGVAHNVHVYSEDPAANPSAKSLFTGTIVTGPTTTTYSLAALPAGSYYFHCDVHPTTMKGRLIVK